MTIIETQLGKQGITENFIETLKNHFKKNQQVRISVLKSIRSEGTDGKKQVKEYAEQLKNAFGDKYKVKVIGFKIIIIKFRHKV